MITPVLFWTWSGSRKVSKWTEERTTGAEAQCKPLLEGSIVSAIILMTLAEVWLFQNALVQNM